MAASIKDVAQRAGVAVGTVSNVINGSPKVAAATSARVWAAIDELGYVRNDAARQLRAGSSRALGFVVLDLANPFFAELVRAAQEAALPRGLMVLVGSSGGDPGLEAKLLAMFLEQRVGGVFLSPAGEVESELEQFVRSGIRPVLVDRRSANDRVSSISVDDVLGGKLAVRHLIAGGRRRIVVAGGVPSLRQVHDRLEGAVEAAAGSGVSIEHRPSNELTVAGGRTLGAAIAAEPLARRPDAIFAVNDLVAIGIMQALVMGAGVRVPDDIALIGYDDIDFAASAIVPLSSIRQPAGEIGRRGVELMLADDEQTGQAIGLEPDLIVRASTGGAR